MSDTGRAQTASGGGPDCSLRGDPAARCHTKAPAVRRTRAALSSDCPSSGVCSRPPRAGWVTLPCRQTEPVGGGGRMPKMTSYRVCDEACRLNAGYLNRQRRSRVFETGAAVAGSYSLRDGLCRAAEGEVAGLLQGQTGSLCEQLAEALRAEFGLEAPEMGSAAACVGGPQGRADLARDLV
jgi:hypothetical protein